MDRINKLDVFYKEQKVGTLALYEKTVHGNGVDPGVNDVLAVANEIGISKIQAINIAKDIKECVHEHLGL